MNPDILISLAPELALFVLAVVVLLTGLAMRARVAHAGQVPPIDTAQTAGGPAIGWLTLIGLVAIFGVTFLVPEGA